MQSVKLLLTGEALRFFYPVVIGLKCAKTKRFCPTTVGKKYATLFLQNLLGLILPGLGSIF